MTTRTSECVACDRTMRDRGEDGPKGSILRATLTMCASCYTVAHRPPNPVNDVDAPSVLVRADIRPTTFLILRAHAARLGVTPGELLSRLADKAVT